MNVSQAQNCIVFEPLPDKEIECSDPLIFDEPVATNTCCETLIHFIFEDEIIQEDCQKTIIRTWHAASDCGGGSISQTIILFDNSPPMITISDPLVAGLNSGDTIVFNCDELDLINPNSITATDTCDPDPTIMFMEFNTDGNCPQDGFIRLMDCSWIAKDRCDNRDTFKIFFKITDLEPPVLTFCPPNIDLECIPASEALPNLTGGEATATDDCGDVMITYMDDLQGDNCTGTITRTWKAEDICGNVTTCIQIITVRDVPPEITCPEDVSLDCSASISPNQTGTATATDDCGSTNISHQDEETGTACNQIIRRTWTAEDACGNISTCEQIIELIDNEAPVITCPADMILECTEGFDPNVTGMATATDNCNEITITHSDETQSGSDDCEHTIIRTFTATDACGNMATCEQLVKLVDTTAPELTCPDDVTLDCSDSSDPSETGMATAIDNCNEVTISHLDEMSGDNCEVIIIRTWTAEDACGNVSTCQQTIILIDNTPPEITCPMDIDLDCTANFDPSEIGMAIATDDCNELTMSHSDEINGNNCEQIITRTWMAEDDCGNVSSCIQVIRLLDTTPPEIVCPDNLELSCTDSFNPSETGMATASDDCNGATISHLDEMTGDDCNFRIVRTWTAEDACGNVSTCQQIIELIDNEAPVITCPANMILECTEDFDPNVTGMAIATDNCNEITITHSDETQSGSDDCEKTIIRTFTATDVCGNITTCEQIIKLVDTTAPELTCPNDVTLDCNDSSNSSETGMAMASDNCNEVTISHSDEMSGDNCETIIIRTWTAEDACGNVSTCEQMIILIDNTAPEITCPMDIDLDCTASFDPSETGIVIATDDCNELTMSYLDVVSGNNCAQIITRTWTAEDVCGNVSTCIQIIRLLDTTPPEIVCPDDIILDCLATETDPSITGTITATDDCNELTISHLDEMQNDVCGMTITRTWIAEDACRNAAVCIQIIKLLDTTPPEITCPDDEVSVQCDSSINPSVLGEATAIDDCNEVNITFVDIDFAGNDCEQIIIRTFTAEDACGNMATCDQTIKISDNTPPTIICPDDVVIDCNMTADPSDTGMATATDNCSEFTISHSDQMSGDACTLVIIRTWRAEDDCGNVSTCQQRIEFTDNTAPEIICPADATLNCSDMAEPSVTGMATATDDCNELNISFEDNINNTACETIITRTWTTQDACGNSSFCTQMITLIDNTPPVITCPADITINCDDSSSTTDTGEATATDDCGEVTISFDDETSGSDCELTITRTWTAQDACGNISTCEQIIQLVDNTAPEIICPTDVTVECGDSTDPSTTGEPTANDNCGAITMNHTDAESGDNCFRFITRTWTIEDACGNVSTCEQIISIQDTTNPEITCPDDIDLDCLDIVNLPNMDTGMATATDACNEMTIEHFDEISGDDCERIITRIWQARDICGNTATCEQIIRLIDNTSPIITCPADLDLDCGTSTEPSTTGEATASDDCNVTTVTHSDDMTNDDCETIITRTWTAEDACGNVSSCEQIIYLRDNVAPEITCPNDIIIECGESLDPSNTGTPNVSDDCTNVNVTHQDEMIDNGCEQIITRIFTATDACGNSATCTQIIKVQDTTAPTIVFTHPALQGVQNGDIVVFECDDVEIFTEADASAEDECSDINVTFTEDGSSGECTEDGYYIQLICTWIAEDACGNIDSVHIIVRVTDTTAPTISGVPGDIMVECEDIPDIPQVTTNDNCEGDIDLFFEESHVENDTACMVIRKWTATDRCGNATVESYRIIRLNCEECTNPFFSEFLNFTAFMTPTEEVVLDWIFTPLSMEHRFVVERSADNDDFLIIGAVNGIHHNGQNSYAYTFTDNSPRAANNFYRIRAVDASAQVTTSEVKLVLLKDIRDIIIYPNPTRNDITAEFVNLENEEELYYELVDVFGHVLENGKLSTENYAKNIALDNVPPGIYLLHFKFSGNQRRSFKVIKSE